MRAFVAAMPRETANVNAIFYPANMKVVTAIYLNMGFEFYEANPNDETPISVDSATAEEESLRGLIDNFLRRRFDSTIEAGTSWDTQSDDDGGAGLDGRPAPDSP